MIALQISHTVQTSREHCSTASHCLALSYWRCSWRFIIGTFPEWPISIVMDAWFDCAKMALSLPCKLLSHASWWAVLSLSPLTLSLPLPLFFPHASDGNNCESYPPKNPFHQEQTYSIIYWFSYLCTLWLFALFPAYLLVFMCFRQRFDAHVDDFTSICMCLCSIHSIRAGQEPDCIYFSPCLILFHIVILHSRCNILLFRNPTINHLNCCWQTSKSFRLAAHFLSISNTQVDSNTKEQKLQHGVCVCVRMSVAQCVDALCVWLRGWKLAGEWEKMSSLWAKR